MSSELPLPKSVLVIGGGPAGLVSLRNLAERGQFEKVELVERRDDVGGVWNLGKSGVTEDDPIMPQWPSPAYPGLVGNDLPEFLSFSGHPFPAPSSTIHVFPTLDETHAYLLAFAQPLFAAKKIRLNTEVVRVEELENGVGWKVTMNDWNVGGQAIVLEEIWDAVVVASGIHEFPLWPATPGLEEARRAGLAKHAKYWNNGKGCEHKRMAVVGNGNSACDVAPQLASIAQTPVYRSLRHERNNVAMLPDPRIIDVVPVDQYTVMSSEGKQSMTLRLRDGSQITDVDEVWICTGYGWAVPFIHVLKDDDGRRILSPLTPASLNLSHIPSLHKFIMYALNPTLGFINHVRCDTAFMLSDLTSTWLAIAWRGEIPYPTSVEGRLVSEKEKMDWVEAQRAGVEEPSNFLHYHVLSDSELDYARGLRKDIVEARKEMDSILPVWTDEMWAKRSDTNILKIESLRHAFEEQASRLATSPSP